MGALWNLSVTKKVGLLILLPTLAAFLGLLLFYSFLTGTADERHFINVAGRQRMLSQELLNYAHTVSIGQEEDREPLRETVATFGDSLNTLKTGGRVMGHDLTPAPPEIRDEVAAVEQLWAEVEPSLLLIADQSLYEPRFQTAVQHVRTRIPLLTTASDRVVESFEARGHALRRGVLYTLATIALFDLTLLIAGLQLTKRYISRPIKLIEEAAVRIKSGDFSQRVPILTGDELASLSATFNEMSGNLRMLLEERERNEAELIYMATHDALTGLYNRRKFQEELEHHLSHALRYPDHDGAVLFLDLDGFKRVNDILGHHAGDELLVMVTALLRGRMRDTDTLARLGGDEFAIILPHTVADQAEVVAEHLLRAVSDKEWMIGGHRIRITASIGGVLFPKDGDTVDTILVKADQAMYKAKEDGRNRYRFFTS